MAKPVVVLSILGSVLDAGVGPKRWEKWRPNVDLCRHEDLVVDRLVLLHGRRDATLVRTVVSDIGQVSPETRVIPTEIQFGDPWDFERVYGALLDFVRAQRFVPEREDYLVHIVTGTHVAQICWFLLTEARFVPGRLLQTSPPKRETARNAPGSYAVIDLDLSRYDAIAQRFARVQREGLSLLKGGIDTRDRAFNALIAEIEHVAVASREPVLLVGPTGAGKTRLAQRIHALRRARGVLAGELVELNCATLRGDQAMSTLFGHVKGAFTGAVERREGLLREANGGGLFLDEISELGADEQAMLLRAIEEKRFRPVGADGEVTSDFVLVAGTNRDLRAAVREGRFREDLLARLDVWTFRLPGLAERSSDIEPNLDHELERAGERLRGRVTMSREARQRFLAFATSKSATWPANFRDLAASVLRMATLAPGGRIDERAVDVELARLQAAWSEPAALDGSALDAVLGVSGARELDRFDRVQLADVVAVCRTSASLSAAGRTLFAASRARKASTNDADRLRKYLARFGLEFEQLRA